MSFRIIARTNGAGVAFNDEIKRNPSWLIENIVRFVRLSRRSQERPCKYDTQNEIRLIFGR